MKKLFNITEEERKKILNLHESATSKQYLSEQSTTAATTPVPTNQTNTPTISLTIDSNGNFTATYGGKKQTFKPENTLKQVKDVFFPGFQYKTLQSDKPKELAASNEPDTSLPNLNIQQPTQQVAAR
jgi:hypothetical protein